MSTPTPNATIDRALSTVLGAMDAAAIAPLLVVEGIDACDMHDVEIDSGMTLVDGDRFDCAGNAFWNYQAGTPSMSDEAYASISGRIVDGLPVVERIAVTVQ